MEINAKDIVVINWVSDTLARFSKDRPQDYVYPDEMRETVDPLDRSLMHFLCLFPMYQSVIFKVMVTIFSLTL